MAFNNHPIYKYPYQCYNQYQFKYRKESQMVAMPAQEIKRRGISAMDADLSSGPVYVIRNNTPRYVVMFADAFREMEESLTAARVAAAEAEFKAGRCTRGSADDLMAELAKP